MRIKKSFLGFLFSLALVLGLMPGMSLTAYADDDYPTLWVNNVQVTSANAANITGEATPTVSYDVASNTLTLNNANITSGYRFQDGWGKAGIYYHKNNNNALNIVLSGNNIISGDDIGIGMCGSYDYHGRFNFSGNGTLTTQGTSSGIYMRGGGVQIDSGTINALGDSSSGINAKFEVVINGGTVEAKGAKQGIDAGYGVSIKGGDVTAIAEDDSNDDAAAISGYNGKHSFTGGNVTVKGGKYGIKMGGSYDIEIGSSITSVTITGTTRAIYTNKKVINSVAGKGWSTVEGTGDGTEIPINTSGGSLGSYKKLLFPYKKPAATVTTAPTAKKLTHTGAAQELVTAGEASGGTMQYALGKDATTAPTNGWSTSIPKGTDAGNYYVWYKVVGDDSHKDSDLSCVEVQIKEKKDDSTIETKVEKKDDTPEVKVEGLDSELAEGVMTDEEKAKVNSGDNVSLTLQMTNIDSSVPEEEKNLTDNALKNENKNSKVGMFFDISLWIKVGQGEARQVTETGKKVIKVTLQVPDNLKAPAGVKRNFYVIHIHNKAAKVIAKTTSMSIPLSLDGFSTFALAYADEADTEAGNIFFSGVKITQKDGKIAVSWDKTKGVAKYEVYATYCGNSYPKKATATTKKNTITLKKINNKKINFKKNFKLYVVAYDSDGNQVGKTVSAHFAGKDNKKYKNVKELKLSTKTITVAVGKTTKIKASTTLEKGKKKELSDSHAAKFRYKSTNKSIATVDKNGKVTGVSAGNCAVYVYSRNGLAKKVSVTVK
ncbi:Ig-like domain-containing protein [Butyrivibrio sp. AD3002]|uniref:Ig-like domain-containing protein n=1 Tax=Butyrivibrio sp. AD3002 TaxID=1280670 RepID=UPI0003B71E39|nr:Ig-like domain-containing protein [Butyrivibrio sp. AD3002]